MSSGDSDPTAPIGPASQLHDLADQLIDRLLLADPFSASQLGLPDFDALVPDASAAGEDALRAGLESIGVAARALAVQAPADRVLQDVVATTVRVRLLDLALRADEYTVTALPLAGPAYLLATAARTVIGDARAAADYVLRLRASAGWLDQETERLREGAAADRTPVASLAVNALAWVDAALAEPAPTALLAPQAPAGWAGQDEWRAELHAVAADAVRPALHRWRAQVEALLPVSRSDAKVGLGWLPGGDEDYANAIERHTTLPLTAQELHDIGLATIEALEAKAQALGAQLGVADLDAVRSAFRASSSVGRDGAIDRARAAVARAEARAAEVVGPPLAPPCAVEPMPETVARSGMAPHYTLPRTDGTRPGTYWFNTLLATMGTGWDLESVAFHEAVPGHHLQLGRPLAHLPRLLTQAVQTVHAEGVGLYAERLSGEMGLYSSVEQEIGAIFMEMHRAVRLVVDTGMHAFGWSRPRAREFLVAHIPVSADFLYAEIDRYIVWPGQALAYLTGQREILRLREVAKAQLGAAFSLPGFHGAVLGSGSIPLPALNTVVQEWISAQPRS